MTNIFEADNLFFTSDLHFDHTNIIRFCNRPFAGTREMNAALISNWNSVVPVDGITFILGDVCWGNGKMWMNHLDQMNGTKYLVIGNHDRHGAIPYSHFAGVDKLMTIQVREDNKEQGLVLCHYPMLAWPGSHHGSWQLFGHIHTQNGKHNYIEKGLLLPTQYDVGVDNNNYTPISYAQIKKIITSKL